MEFTERKKKILAAVTERYLLTGEPVGSKLLCGDLAVSSATVRNEMSDLSENGYLEQPHTSAGRIPSQKGLRYYINNLIKRYDISDSERYAIENRFAFASAEPESVLTAAARLLSELTGCAALASTPYDRHAVIKRVQLVPLSAHTALVVVMMTTGMIKTRLCRCDSEIDYDCAELFYSIAGSIFSGRPPAEITLPVLQTAIASLGDRALSMTPLLITLTELSRQAVSRSVIIEGQSRLLAFKELEPYVYDIFEFFKNEAALTRLIKCREEPFSVLIGRESMIKAFERTGILSSAYAVSGRSVGSLAVIGPVRMDYARIIPSILFTAETVGRVLSDTIDI